jgi:hypothetical protein
MVPEWRAALADSGLAEEQVYLLSLEGRLPDGRPKAAIYPAGRTLHEDDPEDIIFGGAVAEANEPGVIWKQRIAIFTGFDARDPLEVALVAAVLRHELRHAEQRLSRGGRELFALDELADETLNQKMADREGDRALYHFKPTEMDADDAAATFLGLRHPDQVAPMLESFDSPLARSKTPPGPIADLSAKTVAFLFQLKELAEDLARGRDGTAIEERLRQISDAAAEQWLALGPADDGEG